MNSNQRRRPFFLSILLQSLLWENTFPNFPQYVKLIITNLHCIVIQILFQLVFITTSDQDTLTYYLVEISEILALKSENIVPPGNLAIKIIVAVACTYFLSIIVLFMLVVRNYWKNKRPSDLLSALSSVSSQFHICFLFWILNSLLMSYLKNSTEPNLNTVLFAFSVVLVIFNYAFGLLFAISSFDPFISSNALASYSSTFQVLTVLFKAFAAPIIFLVKESSTGAKWTFVIFSIVIFGIRHYYLMTRFPYYKDLTMKILIILSTISSLISLASLLALAIESLSSRKLIYAELLLIPLSVHVMLLLFKRTKQSYLSNDMNSFNDTLKKVFAIRSLLDNARVSIDEEEDKHLNEISLWGVFKLNKIFDESHEEGSNTLKTIAFSKTIRKIVRRLLEEASQKFPRDQRLKIILIHFALTHDQSPEISIHHLAQLAKTQDSSLIAERLSNKLQESLDAFFAENRGKILNLKPYMSQESLCASFGSSIQESTKNHLSFWRKYLMTNIDMKELYTRSRQIQKEAEDIQGIWKKQISENRFYARFLYNMYSSYIALLRGSPFQAQKIIYKFSKYIFEELRAKNDFEFTEALLSDSQTFSVYSSITLENPGKIVKASTNILGITGWSPKDIQGLNVNVLMPDFIALKHKTMLANHINSIHSGEKSTRIYKTISTYILHKEGYVLPCDIYISLHPYVQDSLVYITFIKIRDAKLEQILIAENGKIEGFTRNIGETLYLDTFENIALEDICKNHLEVKKYIKRVLSKKIKQPLLANFFSDKSSHQTILKTYLIDLKPYFFDRKCYWSILFLRDQSKKGQKSPTFMPIKRSDDDSEETCLSDICEQITANRGSKIQIPSLDASPSFSRRGKSPYLNLDEDPPSWNASSPRVFGQYSPTLRDENTARMPNSTQRALLARRPQESRRRTHLEKQKEVQQFELEVMASSSVGSVKRKSRTKLELLINTIPKNPNIQKLFIVLMALMAISGIPLIAFAFKAKNTLNRVHGSGEIISKSVFRIVRFTDTYGYSRIIWQAATGILASDRYAQFGYTGNLIDINVAALPSVLQTIKDNNAALRSYVYQLDDNLRDRMYKDTLPIYVQQSDGSIQTQRQANLFDFATELVSEGTKLVTSGIAYDGTNPYLLFIMNNTSNDALIVGENQVQILKDDSKSKLDDLRTYTYIGMGIIALLGVCVIEFFHNIVRKFTRERSQFINIFIALDEKILREQIRLTERFLASTLKEERDFEKIQSAKLDNKNKGKHLPKKMVTLTGINRILYSLYIAIIWFVFMVFLAYPILSNETRVGSKAVLQKLNLMTQSNLYFYYTLLLFNGIYGYVQEYSTATMKNKPISTEWPLVLEGLTKVQDFMIYDLLDPVDGLGSDTELVDTVVGNLCEIYYIDDPILMGLCPTLGGSAVTKGLVGLSSYTIAALQSVQNHFVNSNKTKEAMIEALANQDLINIEIFYPFTYMAYQKIDELIRAEIVKDFDNFNPLRAENFSREFFCYAQLRNVSTLREKSPPQKCENDKFTNALFYLQ